MQLLAAPSVSEPCPSVRRHRITGHRLLFRLLPDRIQVLDLIPRGELERKIKVLAGQYD